MNKSTSFLKKTQSVKIRNKHLVTKEDLVAVSLAWLCDDVRLTQINLALYGSDHKSTNGAYPKLALGLKEAYSRGLLTIKKK
jgi:hypothetical protein